MRGEVSLGGEEGGGEGGKRDLGEVCEVVGWNVKVANWRWDNGVDTLLRSI